jgi:hypothetical protein
VIDLFEELGIDHRKPAEVSHYYRVKDDEHFYSGFFHFKGKPIDERELCDENGRVPMRKVTDAFSIGFSVQDNLTFFDNKENLVQVEFTAIVPWVIEDEELD